MEILPILESEGTRERIKTRLSEHLERIRGELSADCYGQAADFPPVLRGGNRAEPSGMADESSGQ